MLNLGYKVQGPGSLCFSQLEEAEVIHILPKKLMANH